VGGGGGDFRLALASHQREIIGNGQSYIEKKAGAAAMHALIFNTIYDGCVREMRRARGVRFWQKLTVLAMEKVAVLHLFGYGFYRVGSTSCCRTEQKGFPSNCRLAVGNFGESAGSRLPVPCAPYILKKLTSKTRFGSNFVNINY
jgi:hypothetical protein